jgi:hypothetical protein
MYSKLFFILLEFILYCSAGFIWKHVTSEEECEALFRPDYKWIDEKCIKNISFFSRNKNYLN